MVISGEIIVTVFLAIVAAAVGYGALKAKVDKTAEDVNKSRDVIERDVTSRLEKRLNDLKGKVEKLEAKIEELDNDLERASNFSQNLQIRLNHVEEWASKQGYERVQTNAKFL